jgi:O-antigen ligase
VRVRDLRYVIWVLLISTMGTTLIVNPWTSLDPINLPKMALLVSSATLLVPSLLLNSRTIWLLDKKLIILTLLMLIGLCFSILNSKMPISQQIWGVWGRNTGVLTFFAFITLLLSGFLISHANEKQNLILWLQRTSYVVTIYSIFQIGQLDPIDWSQKATVATLGNINFVSAFMGFANVTFIVSLMYKYLPLSARLNHLIFLSLNIFVISHSKSIQGLAISAAGFVLVAFFKLLSLSKPKFAYCFLVSSLAVGIITFLGTMGLGPLGRFLMQDSVIFRIDYWLAGFEMFRSSPIFGLGMDSYGDFYREFRSEVAVSRTGPGRVSNTAHNVFLDWASGGGLIFLLPIVSLIALCIYRNVKRMVREPGDYLSLSFLGVLCGWIIFLSISINQLGVAVWGFVFLGSALSRNFSQSMNLSNAQKLSVKTKIYKKNRKNSSKSVHSEALKLRSLMGWLVSLGPKVIAGILGLAISLPPVYTDMSYLDSFKRRDLKGAEQFTSDLGTASFHLEKLVSEYLTINDESAALRTARVLVQKFPRNFWGWSVIALNSGSSPAEKREAKRVLMSLDPKNVEAREALESIS